MICIASITIVLYFLECTSTNVCDFENIPFSALWSRLTSSLVSPLSLTTIQLLLRANKYSVLQRRGGGKWNWIDCNSVHQAENEWIMLRNGFWEAEGPPWARPLLCLRPLGPFCTCVFYDRLIKNHTSPHVIPDVSFCDVHGAALHIMPLLVCILECDSLP